MHCTLSWKNNRLLKHTPERSRRIIEMRPTYVKKLLSSFDIFAVVSGGDSRRLPYSDRLGLTTGEFVAASCTGHKRFPIFLESTPGRNEAPHDHVDRKSTRLNSSHQKS